MAINTLKALSLNSRGYAARRTYGNRTTVQGMHADGVPQQRGRATPSGSMSSVGSDPSVGSANPRLLRGDRVAVIRGKGNVDNFDNFVNFDNFKAIVFNSFNFSNFFNS